MYYSTVYVGMDVHKEKFVLCCYTNEKETAEYVQKTDGNYTSVLCYLNAMRRHYGEDVSFVCGYEAGCLGYTLYRDLVAHGVDCVILAPSTMLQERSKRRIKTDQRDAALIARCLAHHAYSPVHVPTMQDEQIKEFIRMRDDHKIALKKIKQQILAFCTRHNYRYSNGSSYWTQSHLKWLNALSPEGLYQEVLTEYLITYRQLVDKLERLEQRILELANEDAYAESVGKLTCFIGMKAITALTILTEVGDLNRFPDAGHFAAYLGLIPGEHSSGGDRNGLGITKAGNCRVRTLLVEAAQSYSRGAIGYKSKALIARQAGNDPNVIAFADRANERLRRRFYHLVLRRNKNANVAKTAVARELACFIWAMGTNHTA